MKRASAGRRVVATIGLCAALTTLLLSCTTHAPEILELFWQINHRYNVDTDTYAEELAFFVHASDEDGEDDFASVTLLNDSTEFYWILQPEAWERPDIPDETWIGHSAIRMYRSEPFPRGAYRVVLTDRAGDRAESTIFISSSVASPEDTEYAALTVVGEEVRISGTNDRWTLWFYDGAGTVVSIVSTTSRVVPLRSVLTRAELDRVTGASVYYYDDERGIGVVSGVYPIKKT